LATITLEVVIVRVWIVVPGEVKIAVADNGVGLPADRTAQIFEPFYTTFRSQ